MPALEFVTAGRQARKPARTQVVRSEGDAAVALAVIQDGEAQRAAIRFPAFKNGFIQVLVLGPLIGLSQLVALRGLTRSAGVVVGRECDHLSRWCGLR